MFYVIRLNVYFTVTLFVCFMFLIRCWIRSLPDTFIYFFLYFTTPSSLSSYLACFLNLKKKKYVPICLRFRFLLVYLFFVFLFFVYLLFIFCILFIRKKRKQINKKKILRCALPIGAFRIKFKTFSEFLFVWQRSPAVSQRSLIS